MTLSLSPSPSRPSVPPPAARASASSFKSYAPTATPPPAAPVVPPPPSPPAIGTPQYDFPTAGQQDVNTKPPPGLDAYAYTPFGGGDMPLIVSEEQPFYVTGAVGTPPIVGELAEGGAANFLNPAWMEQIDVAVSRNGGLGNAEQGYLAFSREHGFVRLKNINMTPEQNRRMAEISLRTGWPVEKIPARNDKSQYDDPKNGEWPDKFIGRFDEEMADFAQNPVENEIKISDGKKRFVLEFNEKAQGFVSYNYKKASGLKGFAQKAMKYAGPVLDIATIAVNVIPGIGQAVSMGLAAASQAIKTGLSWAATGTLKAGQALQAAMSFVLPGGAATPLQAAGLGAANVAAEAIDTGKISAGGVVGAFSPLIPGLPGGAVTDRAVRQGLGVVAHGIDTGRLDAGMLAQALAPLATQLPLGSGREQLVGLAGALADGRVTGREVAGLLSPLADRVSDDSRHQNLVLQGLGMLAGAIDGGQISAEAALGAILPYVDERLQDLRGGQTLSDLLALGARSVDRGGLDPKETVSFLQRLFGVDVKGWIGSLLRRS